MGKHERNAPSAYDWFAQFGFLVGLCLAIFGLVWTLWLALPAVICFLLGSAICFGIWADDNQP